MKIRKILVTIGMLTMVVFAIIGITEGLFFNTSLSLASWIIMIIITLITFLLIII